MSTNLTTQDEGPVADHSILVSPQKRRVITPGAPTERISSEVPAHMATPAPQSSVNPLKAFRMSRLPYWLIAVPLVAAFIFAGSQGDVAVGGLAYIALCGVTWARLNDAGESLWYVACMAIGLFTPIIVLYCLFAPQRKHR